MFRSFSICFKVLLREGCANQESVMDDAGIGWASNIEEICLPGAYTAIFYYDIIFDT